MGELLQVIQKAEVWYAWHKRLQEFKEIESCDLVSGVEALVRKDFKDSYVKYMADQAAFEKASIRIVDEIAELLGTNHKGNHNEN